MTMRMVGPQPSPNVPWAPEVDFVTGQRGRPTQARRAGSEMVPLGQTVTVLDLSFRPRPYAAQCGVSTQLAGG